MKICTRERVQRQCCFKPIRVTDDLVPASASSNHITESQSACHPGRGCERREILKVNMETGQLVASWTLSPRHAGPENLCRHHSTQTWRCNVMDTWASRVPCVGKNTLLRGPTRLTRGWEHERSAVVPLGSTSSTRLRDVPTYDIQGPCTLAIATALLFHPRVSRYRARPAVLEALDYSNALSMNRPGMRYGATFRWPLLDASVYDSCPGV